MMSSEFFVLDTCRRNCPHKTRNWDDLAYKLDLRLRDLAKSLNHEKNITNKLYHTCVRIAIAGCPNGCSQPQIKDLGLIGYMKPAISRDLCLGCQKCVDSCMEQAITLEDKHLKIDPSRCLSCGQCVKVCPCGAITAEETGWNLLQGGRVGRHPRFAEPIGKSGDDNVAIEKLIDVCQDFLAQSLPGERLSYFLERRHSGVRIQESGVRIQNKII